MKVEIEFKDGLAGYGLLDDKGNYLVWENLSRLDQIRICNSLAQGYNLFSRCIKNETGN